MEIKEIILHAYDHGDSSVGIWPTYEKITINFEFGVHLDADELKELNEALKLCLKDFIVPDGKMMTDEEAKKAWEEEKHLYNED